MPTKFTSYLYITIHGQMHGFGLYGIMTADLIGAPFFRPSFLTGNFRYELHDGSVIVERFSATEQ